jgi:hypothetical protein
MSSNTPSDDYSEEGGRTPFSDGVRRAQQLVEHAENRIKEYCDDLTYYRSRRDSRQAERLIQGEDLFDLLESDVVAEYDPVRPLKLTVTNDDGKVQTVAGWKLCDTDFEGHPIQLYVDADSQTYQAYITWQEHGGGGLPMPFVAEDLANYDLDQVAHLVEELKRQGEELVLRAAQVSEG